MEWKLAKEYVIGAIISLILLVVLLLVDAEIYNSVMPLGVSIVFITLHVTVYRYLIPERKYAAYVFFILIMGMGIFLSLPEYTHQQAKEKVLGSYDIEFDELGNLPLEDSWNPLASKWAYAFEGSNPSDQTRIGLLVIPQTGKVFEIAPSEIPLN